jgi:glycosyltransferase involved in cell wall biosynthesis
MAAKWHKLPLVITSHGGDLNLARKSRALYALSAQISRAADACIGVSEALAEDFRSMGVPPERATFIPLGVEKTDPGLASELEKNSDYRRFREFDGLRLVYVGSLIPRKSVSTLLEACEVLERRGHQVACALVGSGPTETELKALVRTKALENVLFLGFQPPAVAQRWLAAADVFVLPSRSEGRPVAIMEAMVNGIPVVATDIPGSRELVQHGRTGLLFPPEDIMALADSVESLIKDAQLRTTMGRRGEARVKSEGLLVSDVAIRHLELYERLRLRQPKTRHE